MICALMIGRAGSTGFPGKNIHPVLGRPLAAYPLMAARSSRYVESLYVSTDSPEIAEIGKSFGADLIDRPPELAGNETLADDVFVHCYLEIARRIALRKSSVEFMVLLFANAATVSGDLIDQGIEALRSDPSIDSAVSVSIYNMWSPIRARKIGDDACLHPFVPFESLGDSSKFNCDRNSQGNVYYADMGVSIVRPRCLEEIEKGLLPQRWMGQKIHPVLSWGGCDVDYEWQIPMVDFWLRKLGIKEASPENL